MGRGAFSAGGYDGKPYILMNYEPTVLDHVFTLTHEAGHSMHTWYSVDDEPRAVRGPVVAADITGHRHRARVATPPVQQHDLTPVRAGHGREKGEIPAVGTPARPLDTLRRRGQSQALLPVPADHPDGTPRLIGLVVSGGQHVRHPATVRRHLRIADVLDPLQVVCVQSTARRDLRRLLGPPSPTTSTRRAARSPWGWASVGSARCTARPWPWARPPP